MGTWLVNISRASAALSRARMRRRHLLQRQTGGVQHRGDRRRGRPVTEAEQAGGLGKRMLASAERYAADELGARVFRMSVLVSRTELIAFYLRRGYLRSGRLEGFPDDAGAGVPRVPGLQLETLVKEA